MGLSKITINFLDGNRENTVATFRIKGPDGDIKGGFLEVFRFGARNNFFEIGLGNQLSDGIYAVGLYIQYLDLDYNSDNKFLIERTGIQHVSITCNLDNYIFQDISFPHAQVTVENDTAAEVVVDAIQITDETVVEASADPANKFKLDITTDKNFDDISVNNIDNGWVGDTNVYQEDFLRDVAYSWKFYRTGNPTEYARFPSSGSFKIPKLIIDNFDIKIGSNVSGGTLRVAPSFVSRVNYEYKLVGQTINIDWSTVRSFLNLPDGNYTISIRDKYGSNLLGTEISTGFVSAAVKLKKPFVNISKLNSLTFIKEEETDDYSIFNNHENSFSSELFNRKIACSRALYKSNDSIRIQLQTSYENLIVKLRKEDLSEEIINTTQLTDNLNKYKHMDCFAIGYQDNKTAVYFTSGKLYTPGHVEIGEYNLNGNLPEFAEIGNHVELGSSGSSQIIDIVYISSIDKNCIILDLIYSTSVPAAKKIQCTYNIIGFNVYDFLIDFTFKNDSIYDIFIELTDADIDFPDLCYVSENIDVKEEHENTVAIQYFNSNNRDIFYKYDIEHFIRYQLINAKLYFKDEVQNNISDSSVNIIKSTLNHGYVFEFEEMTEEEALKLGVALSCENVFINGVGFVKDSEFDISPIENTNLVTFTAEMLKNGINYSNISGDVTVVDSGIEEIFVPNILTDKNNFIKF